MSIVFVQIVGASMVLPILPLYAKREFGMSDTTVTLLITVFFAAQFIAGPFIGRLSDKYGRVPVLILSQIGTVFSFAGLGLAQAIWVLFAARTLDGITGGNIIVARAYITDIVPREQRTEALGYLLVSFGVGFIVGPAIGGILASQFGYVTPYFAASGAAAVVVLLTMLFLEETVSEEARALNRAKKETSLDFKAILSNMPLMSVLAIGFGSQLAFSMLQATFSLFGEAVIFAENPEQTELGVGLLLAMAGIGQISAQAFLIRRLVKWVGESPLIVIGGVLRGLPLFMLLIYPDPVFVGLALFIFSLGSGVQGPALQSLATNTVDDSDRGGVLGVYQSALSLSIIVGSAIAGALFSITPQMPFLVGGVIFMIMLVPSVMLVRWAQKQDFSGNTMSKPVTSSGD